MPSRHLENLRYGVGPGAARMADRGDVLNTRPADELLAALRAVLRPGARQ